MKSESGLSNDYVLHSKVLDNPDDLSKDDLKPKAFDQMRQEFLSFIQADENLIEHEQHHFWRYRKTKLNTEQKFYCCKNEKVYICGDSFVESNDIEAAFLSAQAVFDDLKQKGAIHV